MLDHGKVAEFGTPRELVQQKGLFYELVREANLMSYFEPTGGDDGKEESVH